MQRIYYIQNGHSCQYPSEKKFFGIFHVQQKGRYIRLHHGCRRRAGESVQAFALFDKKALQHGQK